MTAQAAPLTYAGEEPPRRERARWLACGAVVLFAHACVAAALIGWQVASAEDEPVGDAAIIVEFQPEQVPTEPAPEVVKQIETDEPLPAQQSEAMLPPKPQKTLPEPPREEVPYVPPRPAQARAEVATWKSAIVTLLEHNKRYPADARGRGEQGVAQLAFRVDRDGHLISSRIVASSGSSALDAETIALVQRAQPFPPPPPELASSEMIVPLRFNIR